MTASHASVMRVFTTYQRPDYYSPWQTTPTESALGSAVLVGPNQILTGAHVVADATFIQIQKLSAPDKAIAQVIAICHDSDLALLAVDDDSFLHDLTPAELGGLPEMREPVSVVGFPVGGEELSITEGVVSRIEVQRYTQSGRHLLAITVDAAINNGNSGGPVFNAEGLVIGIAFQGSDDTQNQGEMVPIPLIQHFLDGIANNRPLAIPELGIRVQNLENPTMRMALGMKPEQTGVVVRSVSFGGSASGILRAGDVIMTLAGQNLANNETVRFRNRFRTSYHALMCEYYVGEELELGILRKGEARNLKLTLEGAKPLVPEHQYETVPTYFVFAGLVFQPLSLDYLCAWDDWEKNAPNELVYEYDFGRRTEERQAIVILSQVLPDEINVGYGKLHYRVVRSLNGIPPRHMTDFVKRLESTQGFVEIELSSGECIVLDFAEAQASGERILSRYRIGQDRSPDLD